MFLFCFLALTKDREEKNEINVRREMMDVNERAKNKNANGL